MSRRGAVVSRGGVAADAGAGDWTMTGGGTGAGGVGGVEIHDPTATSSDAGQTTKIRIRITDNLVRRQAAGFAARM